MRVREPSEEELGLESGSCEGGTHPAPGRHQRFGVKAPPVLAHQLRERRSTLEQSIARRVAGRLVDIGFREQHARLFEHLANRARARRPFRARLDALDVDRGVVGVRGAARERAELGHVAHGIAAQDPVSLERLAVTAQQYDRRRRPPGS